MECSNTSFDTRTESTFFWNKCLHKNYAVSVDPEILHYLETSIDTRILYSFETGVDIQILHHSKSVKMREKEGGRPQ